MRRYARIIGATYLWLVVGAGAWCLSRLFPLLDLDFGGQLLAVAGLLAAAEVLAVPFPQGQLSGGFALVAATFLLFGAPAAAWVEALSVLVAQGVFSRDTYLRVAFFNAAQRALAVAAGGELAALAGGRTDLPVELLAFAGGYFAVNQVLVYLYAVPNRSSYPAVSWRGVLRWDGLACLCGLPLGILVAVLYHQMGFSGLLLSFVPLLVLQFVLRLYVRAEMANRELMALFQVARRLQEKLNARQVAELLLKESRRVVGYHSGVVYLRTSGGGEEVFRACEAAGPFRDKLLRGAVVPGEGFLGRLLLEGEAMLVHDTRAVAGQAGYVRGHAPPETAPAGAASLLAGEPGPWWFLRSLMVVPLSTRAGAVGLLVIGDKRPYAFSEHHLHTISVMAGQAAVALANALLVQSLEESANTDGLTGVYNHRYFIRRAAREIERARRSGQPLALIMLDVDNFKLINDRFGHQVGDEVLCRLAGLLCRAVGEAGVVCRYGGEEFAVLLPGFDARRAGELAERLRRLVEGHEFPAGTVRVSMGVAACPRDALEVAELIRKADRALYAAKQAGKNRVVVGLAAER